MTRRTLLGGGVSAGIAAGLLPALRSSAAAVQGPASALVVDGLDVSLLDESFLDLLRQGSVDCVHKSVRGIRSIGAVYQFADQHADRMSIAKSVREIRAAAREGKVAFILGWQVTEELEQALRGAGTYPPLAEVLRGYHELGLRITGICYNTSNLFGGGCLDPRGPLTRAGRRLVEEIHQRRLILDIGGHTGEQTSLDAIEISKGIPVVCTHTNMAALNANMRCISDRLALAIAATGGVIGLAAVNDFHVRNPHSAERHGNRSPQATLDVHLDQYDHLKKLVGIEHIGLGPDFTAGIHGADPPGNISIEWPGEEASDGELVYVKDYENISMLPNVINGLELRGWTGAELDQLLGTNWLRVYERVWGA